MVVPSRLISKRRNIVAKAIYISHQVRFGPRQLLGPLLNGISQGSRVFASSPSHRSGLKVSGSLNTALELCTKTLDIPTTVPPGMNLPEIVAPAAGTIRGSGDEAPGDILRLSLIDAVRVGSPSNSSRDGGPSILGHTVSTSARSRSCNGGWSRM